MNLSMTITDNITELLVKIIKFTNVRHKILADNINNVHIPGFVPRDLPVNEFSDSLNRAITEHSTNNRLVLFDSQNVKFGSQGSFEAKSIVDQYSKELLEENQDQYIEFQINKLLENSLNQKVAKELLKQNHRTPLIFD